MSFWELVKNSPEWVGVIANALFAATTIGVIIWQVRVMRGQTRVMQLQVRVMRWQSHISARHERTQNRLIHLQHEHESLLRLNGEREQLLKLARRLHVAASCLEQTYSDADRLHWEDVQDSVHELGERLRILDLGAYGGVYDMWYDQLEEYVEAMRKVVFEDAHFRGTSTQTNEIPTIPTRMALKDVDYRFKPVNIFLDLETAIRMEFFDFKNKWDAALPS